MNKFASVFNSQVRILYLVFFISGVAALVYQILWQRILTFFTGSDITSVSLIVGAYMAGLGLGSLAGGFVSDRITNQKRLLYFSIAELLIAVFACCSKLLFYDYLYGAIANAQLSNGIVFIILFTVLLVPTFLMGASLPLLSKSYVNSVQEGVRLIGNLYFVNTLGASVGAVLSILFVRFYGFDLSIYLTAGLNLLCFIIALLLSQNNIDKFSQRIQERDSEHQSSNLIFWISVFCLTGFIAVSLEILWFRMLTVIIKPLFITFPVLLSIYIGGLAIGSRFSRFIPNTYTKKASLFFGIQLLIAFYVGVSIIFFLHAVEHYSWLKGLKHYMEGYEAMTDPMYLLGLYGFLVPYFILIPTLLMGFSFVLLQSLLQNDVSNIGKNLGLAQFMNIVGSSLGAICTSWVFIHHLGTPISFLLLTSITALFSLAVLLTNKKRWNFSIGTMKLVFLFLVLIALYLFPTSEKFWSTLHGKEVHTIIWKEDETGLAAIKLGASRGIDDIVFCNGIGQSHMNFERNDMHVAFGLLPAMLHPAPRNIAIIGLGSGSTLYGSGGNVHTQSITCFEIIKPQKEVLEMYDSSYHNSGLRSILLDTRIQFLFGDARYALRTSDKKYDIIEADALRINSAYSGNLYSKEYFELLQAHLAPGGFAVTWTPSERVEWTVASVFRYYVKYGYILIASDSPIPSMDLHPSEFAKRYYAQSGIDLDTLLKEWEANRFIPANNNPNKDLNYDLFPKDEFAKPVDSR